MPLICAQGLSEHINCNLIMNENLPAQHELKVSATQNQFLTHKLDFRGIEEEKLGQRLDDVSTAKRDISPISDFSEIQILP